MNLNVVPGSLSFDVSLSNVHTLDITTEDRAIDLDLTTENGIVSISPTVSEEEVYLDVYMTTEVVTRQGEYEDYEGPYEQTSFVTTPLLTTSVVLATNDKHMTDDVTFYSVPTSEEYNDQGGVTFTIGG